MPSMGAVDREEIAELREELKLPGDVLAAAPTMADGTTLALMLWKNPDGSVNGVCGHAVVSNVQTIKEVLEGLLVQLRAGKGTV